jgi:hypothetical protein
MDRGSDLVNASLDLFGGVAADLAPERLAHAGAAVADLLAEASSEPPVVLAARDGFGQFWPYRACAFIVAQRSHRDRALAFRAVPPAFAAMVAALIHRAIFEVSRA